MTAISARKAMRYHPARGNLDIYGHRSVAIRFDDDLFETIRKRALRQRTAFAAEVRSLINQALGQENRGRS